MSKLTELKKLRKEFDIKVNWLENLPINETNLIVANHNCLMDIFLLPSILPFDAISLVSSRVAYKNEVERKQMVDNYLYAMPIEVHGGKVYSDICLDVAAHILNEKYNMIIFPEGVYEQNNMVFRGRTGTARILYNCANLGLKANLVPVAIDIDTSNMDLNDYLVRGNKVTISILEKIDYIDYYNQYIESKTMDEKKEMLHKPLDLAMKNIAYTLNRKYCNEYLNVSHKDSIIFENGEYLNTSEANSPKYTLMYKEEIEKRKEKVLKLI